MSDEPLPPSALVYEGPMEAIEFLVDKFDEELAQHVLAGIARYAAAHDDSLEITTLVSTLLGISISHIRETGMERRRQDEMLGAAGAALLIEAASPGDQAMN